LPYLTRGGAKLRKDGVAEFAMPLAPFPSPPAPSRPASAAVAGPFFPRLPASLFVERNVGYGFSARIGT